MAYYSFTVKDYSREKSTIQMPIVEPTEGIDTEVKVFTELASMLAAIQPLTLGVIERAAAVVNVTQPETGDAASSFAQRELGLRIVFRDTVNQKLSFVTIPAPDLDALTLNNSDEADITVGALATLVSELDTNGTSADGNPIAVERAYIVGRNS